MMDNGGAHQKDIMATKDACQETYDRAQTSARNIGELIKVLCDKKFGEESPSAELREEINDKFTIGLLNILQLREHHRELCLMVEKIRDETSMSKSELDVSSLHLQNLLYEKHHYQREIRSCQSYRSAYTDEEIELIPEDEFHRYHEEKVKLQADCTAGMQVETEEKVGDQVEEEAEDIEIEEEEKEPLSPDEHAVPSQDPSEMYEDEVEEGEQLEIEDDIESGLSDREDEKRGQEEYGISRAGGTVRDEAHELMIRRLEHEAELREGKREALQVLKEHRDGLAAELAQQRNILNGIEVEVKKLKEYVLEAQKSFELDQSQIQAEADALSAFLPAPLFILFTGLRAAAETACAPIAMEYNIQLAVDISGSGAEMMREKIRSMDMGSTATLEDGKESAVLANLSKDLYSRDAKPNEPYPLSVVIRASLNNEHRPLEFVFSFYPRLGCVLVSGSGDKETSILQNVEKDATELKIDPAFELPGHSFSWAQMASGIDILPDGVFWSSDHPNRELVSAIQSYQSERRSSSILTKLLDSIECFNRSM